VPSLRFPEFRDIGEWEHTRLGKIGEFIGGGTPETSVAEYWDGDIQWFTPTEIKEKYLSKSKRTITEKGLKNSSAKSLPKGTLLLSTRATVGDVGIAVNPCSTNQGFQSLLVKESEINVFWYYWLICHKNDLLRKSSGSTFLEIGKGEIQKVDAFRPQKEEQKKIADCLAAIDALITAQTQKRDALKANKKGLMQQLFPAEGETQPKLSFPEFRDMGDWEVKRLGDICEKIMDGTHFSPKSKSGTHVYLTSKNIKNGVIDLSNVSYISEEEHRQIYKKCPVMANDILLTKDGANTGNCALNNLAFEFSLLSSVAVLRGSKLFLDQRFLYQAILSEKIQRLIKESISGQAITRITLEKISNFSMSMPSLPEQQKIADCLVSFDALITAQIEKIDALKTHKKGLMQQLFPAMDEVST